LILLTVHCWKFCFLGFPDISLLIFLVSPFLFLLILQKSFMGFSYPTNSLNIDTHHDSISHHYIPTFISLFHIPNCIFNWKSLLRLKLLDSTAFHTSPLNVPWCLRFIIYRSSLSYLNLPLLSTVYSSECYYSPCSHSNWKCGSYLRLLPCGSISKNSDNDNYHDFNVTTI